ncbi:MAG: elongation factor 4 [Candidatus Colwellbacteria bacterium RIFCSPLOWO2_02_FULL_44_20b]|uniref:Elongation factor 4 n=1 Tax=Candidatus Colwellbacteria bacterium RIFCSPLOWO2_02_FULL_44_20b TaxID=1797691 RepID=A0A1G1Z635_9BACT|nr:MAG: elongation factor 4 [Candidatus Colwellbacteria bacterium RIFCSPLOWO2_02_FULL_44_20b]
MNNIRNFCIIAHIDHGKSTLADRFLEVTGTVSKREMRAQYLDQLDLERERGITIKMAPVRMQYAFQGTDYILNLIDTPGHSDFSYEVSRALKAVEGAILLVDATQGIQAQTLSNFLLAKQAGLTIIGAINKVDLNPTGILELTEELAKLLQTDTERIHLVSGKSGVGVEELLGAVIKNVPPPTESSGQSALIFDSFYDDHKGVVAHVRVFGGSFKQHDDTRLIAQRTNFKIKEIGYFVPQLKSVSSIYAGEIGYIATGLKDPSVVKIGDTIGDHALHGYREPQPVVFVAFYPEEADDYENLKSALQKLHLNDSSFVFDPDFSEVLGRGFRCGFLGRLHFEITAQRLDRDFGIKVLNSFPSVIYRAQVKRGEWFEVSNPKDFPSENIGVEEPIVKLLILTPPRFLGAILGLRDIYRLSEIQTETLASGAVLLTTNLPLSELILDFDDRLKSISEGYASFSYEILAYAPAEAVKMEVLVAEEAVPGLTRIVHRDDVERESRQMVQRLKDLLPRQQFAQAIQATALGRILARETIPAFHKDVTGYLYGGDRTRKMKLWKKQKRGKARLKARGRVTIPPEVFKELLKR